MGGVSVFLTSYVGPAGPIPFSFLAQWDTRKKVINIRNDIIHIRTSFSPVPSLIFFTSGEYTERKQHSQLIHEKNCPLTINELLLKVKYLDYRGGKRVF
jgi:hypothetical protein